MDIDIINSDSPAPTQYAHTLSMVIKSFKGRRDVEVHLFRGAWTAEDEKDENWTALLSSSDSSDNDSRRVVMEAFTETERDRIVSYLKEQYSTRLTAIRSRPLSFPVPEGMPGLSQLEAGKNVGFIEFEKIPSYSLDIPLRGLYDLSQHLPIVQE
ncbi:hypothetical protein [uncultured Pseudodesulfovibrio sp.]|uniref:hypothetical protein n=1 Tax=uncultured Pseudodesulfovibrio sp. TaxID=2035858 RepID=UPI0029C8D390|nr:hypothetical protein [uncultured Pseudodesulfovibrio sp.]